MIIRESYLEKLNDFIDKPFVKILSGIRRSGKSTILLMLQESLKARGVSEKNIVFLISIL